MSQKHLVVNTYHYTSVHLSKHIEGITPRVNPNANYGLWVTMMCQCRLSNCNKNTTLVKDVDNGEAVHVWGQGTYGK